MQIALTVMFTFLFSDAEFVEHGRYRCVSAIADIILTWRFCMDAVSSTQPSRSPNSVENSQFTTTTFIDVDDPIQIE